MKNYFLIILFLLTSTLLAQVKSDSTETEKPELLFKGQASAWANFNPSNPYPLYIGGRYLPQLNYEIPRPDNKLFDFEASANITGQTGIHFFDSLSADGDIAPYRLWARYSTKQMEIRFGLQKINFGPAMMLRSLRWFDQVDPRDPLQITTGVYGGLFRYYFLNNANLWVWGLYGNKNPKGMEFIPSNEKIPEYGMRFQFPVKMAEIGLTFNNRFANTANSLVSLPIYVELPEYRFAVDFKLDWVIGLWAESFYSHHGENLGFLTDQITSTLGMDYTFGIGNGLNATWEHLNMNNGADLKNLKSTANFSAMSLRYPLGLFDNISLITYYNWSGKQLFNFVSWIRQFNRFELYLMAYWNPENAALPTGGVQNLYGGKGLQIMLVYNH